MADDEEFVIDLSQETPVPQTTATEQTLVPQTTVTVKYFRQEYGTWKKLQNVLERKRTKDLEWQDKRLTTLKGLSGKQLDLLDADQGAYRFLERAVLQTIEKIDKNAFMECLNLKTIQGNNITKISDWGVGCCTNLYSAWIPNVKYLGEGAFRDCPNLELVCVNRNTKAERYAFYGCSFLRTEANEYGFPTNVDYVDPDGIPDPTQGILRYLKCRRASYDVMEAKYTLLLILKHVNTKIGNKRRVKVKNNKIFTFLTGLKTGKDMSPVIRIIFKYIGIRSPSGHVI